MDSAGGRILECLKSRRATHASLVIGIKQVSQPWSERDANKQHVL